MSSPFPLRRLPRLVLCEVFKSLSIGEKIKLFLCSKRISTQINNARLYSQKVIVVLDILHQGIRVCSEYNENTFDIINCYDNEESNKPYIKQYRIAGCTIPVICFTNEINIFWTLVIRRFRFSNSPALHSLSISYKSWFHIKVFAISSEEHAQINRLPRVSNEEFVLM